MNHLALFIRKRSFWSTHWIPEGFLYSAVLLSLSVFLPISFAADICSAVAIQPPVDCQSATGFPKDLLESRSAQIRTELLNPNSHTVLVIAHRGDWRHAPENSLQAIANCIDMGVDVVELDIAMTKDKQLVLMHDKTLDRTTTGSGYVSDFTLNELNRMRLKNSQDIPTRHRIPTLKEALLLAKDNILINLDKAYYLLPEVIALADATQTLDQIIIKGKVTFDTAANDLKQYDDSLLFMPIVNLDEQDSKEVIENYTKQGAPIAFEFVFEDEPIDIESKFMTLRKNGSRVWVNSLWSFFNAGHDDDLAVHDIDGSYGWIVRSGANMIQTDRPQLLLDYLRAKGLHQ